MEYSNFEKTDIGKMIGDINNLDWMDFEKLKNDVSFGFSIKNEKIFLVVKFLIRQSLFKFKKGNQCFTCEIKRDKNIWKGHEGGNNFMNIDHNLTPRQFDLLVDITSDKICKIERYHLPISEDYIGKFIGTPKAWKRKIAVERIERNWLVCRYEPRYKMCENVLMHNIEEAEREYLSSL